MAKEYVCDNCGYVGDHYKYMQLEDAMNVYPNFFIWGLLFRGDFRVCPQCKKRSIKIVRSEVNPFYKDVITGSLPGKKWTTKSLIILVIIVVFILIVLPILYQIYFLK